MIPVSVLALLGVNFLLPGVQALLCQLGKFEIVRNMSELPLQWTPKEQSCETGWGCQDTLVLTENGPYVNLILTKGCTEAEDQEARVMEHRTGPGISIVSYTHVCRHKDLCNNLVNTSPLWALPIETAPGRLRCPTCLSVEGCPETVPEQTCPVGHTHCYNGVLLFTEGLISTILKVQGCMPQPGCNLFNGTREIGPMAVSENCNPKDFLTCHRGLTLWMRPGLSQEPVNWTVGGSQICNTGEVCQETLLLIDVGQSSLLLGSKGCSKIGAQESQRVSVHLGPPGVLIASYTRLCSSDHCNRANTSSVLLNALPRPAAPAPGNVSCPVCVQLSGSCSPNSDVVTCPSGTTHCYDDTVILRGGGLSSPLSIQGCVAQPTSSLSNRLQNIGIFSVTKILKENEDSDNYPLMKDGVAPVPYLSWVMGLGPFLVLWLAGTGRGFAMLTNSISP
ncbi:CD177 antigen [Tupaia chinensis]|uniref:CD177 antigen n=1 Tax=Tupaia chinensis TaxID=246437 RepID=UPI0003C8F3DC|nr:CD177 antigen [Tupaia chinensis]